MRIADSLTDTLVVLRQLADHSDRPSRANWVDGLALLGLFALVIVAGAVGGTADGSFESWPRWGIVAGFGAAIACLYSGLRVLVVKTSTYSAHRDGFSAHSPLGFGSWALKAQDIATIDLRFDNRQYKLVVSTATGQRREFLLGRSLHGQLLALYPELGNFGESPLSLRLPPWIGRTAYGLLGLSMVAFIMLVIWIFRQELN